MTRVRRVQACMVQEIKGWMSNFVNWTTAGQVTLDVPVKKMLYQSSVPE